MRHTCPRRGCQVEVDNRRFCCTSDWWALSRETRAVIHATARLNPLEERRRNAFAMAKEDWDALDAGSEL